MEALNSAEPDRGMRLQNSPEPHGVLDTYKRKADRSREFFTIVEERRPALAAKLNEVKALARKKVEEGLTPALPKPRERNCARGPRGEPGEI